MMDKPNNLRKLDMDISKIGKTKDTSEVTLYHPVNSEVLTNDDKSPMTITIYGPNSSQYKAINHAQQNRRLQKAQRTNGKMNLTAQEIESAALDLLVKCTSGWNITVNKECPDCVEVKVKDIYVEFPWIRDQVDAALNDAQAFLAS
jgi:hypothetical protein